MVASSRIVGCGRVHAALDTREIADDTGGPLAPDIRLASGGLRFWGCSANGAGTVSMSGARDDLAIGALARFLSERSMGSNDAGGRLLEGGLAVAEMSAYAKAYPLSRLKAFAGWRVRAGASSDQDGVGSTPLDADCIVYVHASHIVTRGVFEDDDVVFDDVTSDWKDFCSKELGFELPDYARSEARD